MSTVLNINLFETFKFELNLPKTKLGNAQRKKVELNQEVKDLVETYLDKNPRLTVNALATRSQVPATTLRRILSGKTKSEVSPHTVLGLVSYIHREKRISKILELADGQIASSIEKNFSRYIFEDSEYIVDESLNAALKEKTAYFVYKLAANKSGVSRDFVRVDYGQQGIRALDKLIESGWIDESDGVCHAKEKNYSLDVNISLNHNRELLNFFKLEEAGEGNNLYYTLSESLNEMGIKKLKEIKREALKKLQEIVNEEFYQGSIPYFSMMMSDTMIHSKEATPKGEVLQ